MPQVSAWIALTAVAVSAAVSLTAGRSALAEPAQPPVHCTAADLAGVAAGVSASTSVYLFTCPVVNDFFTNLRPVSDADKQAKIDEYFAANPQTADEVKAIRKPLQDVNIRYGDTDGDGDDVIDIL